ncbi:hypothetical protein [Ignatzschineria cameli]|uniref:Sialate O-acetylesterase domain-containing protein n=1 Tax=Ignatzschineria cameli TaxID=2182793 RepID=A0A2U2AQA3_9GAMM|nr:hypothetical protein [Ignatzschineria cameli]PWD85793.1 hypothetical protein DC077_07095 [Ignatzschineria cameli]PWD89421.1 hypothetical protein DC079_06720 [Ignatzschineria cameli]PWD90893.1 hypothetical protein DC081_06430 [Ignatzschineria cameli]PWD91681.1 hypothetical protein DC078_06715 [Ignatzschineria cameli]
MSRILKATNQLEDDVNKANIFVHGDEDATYTAKDGTKVRSIRNLQKEADINVKKAQEEARRAEAAADRAEVGAMPAYINHSELPKSAVNGAMAQVTNDIDPNKNGYYVWDGEKWIYSDIQPAQNKDVKDLESIISKNKTNKLAFAFVDNESTKNVIASLYEDGGFCVRKILLNETVVSSGGDGISVADSNGFIPLHFGASYSNLYGLKIEPANADLVIKDQNGFVVFYIGNRGIFGITNHNNEIVERESQKNLQIGRHKKSDINHILTYGQSLSRGQRSMPAISVNQEFKNIMIKSGVKSRYRDVDYDASEFVPMIEQDVGNEGETPTSGCLNGLSQRIDAGGYGSDWVFLGSSTGQGGQTIQSLSEFGISRRFSDTVNLIKDCKAIADKEGRSYSVWSMIWYQGESDYSANSNDNDSYSYIERWLSSMWEPLKKNIAKITGQEFSPYLFTYQVAAHRRYDSDEMSIAIAQWRASRMYDDVILAAPAYIFQTASDDLHLTNEASWLMGEYTSRAIFQTMIARSGKFRPLEPVSVEVRDMEVVIEFHVPTGKLVIDNALCESYENAGFIFRDKDDVVMDDFIASVELVGRNAVLIKTKDVIPLDAKITYARGKPGDRKASGPISGARGNLRDEAGLVDTAISPLGNIFLLHNACVMFEYSLKSGF